MVRLGLESMRGANQEFFKKLKENLADNDPENQDRMVDEFRADPRSLSEAKDSVGAALGSERGAMPLLKVRGHMQ